MNRSGLVLFRIVSFGLAFLVSASAVWVAGELAVASSGADRGPTALDIMGNVRTWRKRLAHDHRRRRVALIGDSMLGSEGDIPSLADMVPARLNASKPKKSRVSVHPLVVYGWTMIGEYCAADEIIAAKPELVVLELNLRALQPFPLAAAGFPELGGLIRGPRLLEAALLPLSDAGITLDRLLFHRLLVKYDLEDPWLALFDRQARLLNSRDVLERWIEKKTHVETVDLRKFSSVEEVFRRQLAPGGHRSQRWHVEATFGAVLGGMERPNARLEVLGALLDHLRRAGVPVLVWASPVNVEYMRSLGLSMSGLDRSMVTIRRTVEQNGATFLDLHALLRDEAFRDLGDHYTLEGEVNGAEHVAEPLAEAIQSALQ